MENTVHPTEIQRFARLASYQIRGGSAFGIARKSLPLTKGPWANACRTRRRECPRRLRCFARRFRRWVESSTRDSMANATLLNDCDIRCIAPSRTASVTSLSIALSVDLAHARQVRLGFLSIALCVVGLRAKDVRLDQVGIDSYCVTKPNDCLVESPLS